MSYKFPPVMTDRGLNYRGLFFLPVYVVQRWESGWIAVAPTSLILEVVCQSASAYFAWPHCQSPKSPKRMLKPWPLRQYSNRERGRQRNTCLDFKEAYWKSHWIFSLIFHLSGNLLTWPLVVEEDCRKVFLAQHFTTWNKYGIVLRKERMGLCGKILTHLTYNQCIQIYVKGHNLSFSGKKKKERFPVSKIFRKREQVGKRKKISAIVYYQK